jgi:hypothetical protein
MGPVHILFARYLRSTLAALGRFKMRGWRGVHAVSCLDRASNTTSKQLRTRSALARAAEQQRSEQRPASGQHTRSRASGPSPSQPGDQAC